MKKPKAKRPDAILAEAAALYKQRNAVYKDNIFRVGEAMAKMFPNGVTLKTPQDWHRMHMLLLIQIKFSRYATNFDNGGHADSVRDAIVYNAILDWIDQL